MPASTKQPRWQPPQSLHPPPSHGAIRKGKSITSDFVSFSLFHASSFGTAATFRRNALLTRFILGAPPSLSARHSPTLSCFGAAPREADGDEINTSLSRCSYMLPKLVADAPDVMATRCDTYGGKVAPGENGSADGNLLSASLPDIYIRHPSRKTEEFHRIRFPRIRSTFSQEQLTSPKPKPKQTATNNAHVP